MIKRPPGPPPEAFVDVLFESFLGRKDRFAVQQDDGTYLAVKKPLSKSVLLAHCKGQVTIASYTTNDQGMTHIAMLDIDSKGPAAKELVIFSLNWLRHFNIPAFLEPSGGKGYHTLVLFKCWVPAAKARALLQALVNDWNVDHEGEIPPEKIELFPKQIAPATFDNPGTGAKLPWGFHRTGQKWTPIMGPDTKPLADWGLSIVNDAPRFTEPDLDVILEEYPNIRNENMALNRIGHTVEEIVRMLTNGITVGARRPTLVTLSGYLRHRGIPEDVAVGFLIPWSQVKFAEQLPTEEIERHIRGIYKRYGVRTPATGAAHVLDEIPDEIQEVWK